MKNYRLVSLMNMLKNLKVILLHLIFFMVNINHITCIFATEENNNHYIVKRG